MLVVKNSPANEGDAGLIPGSARSPEEGNDNPLQYFCLENSLDRGTWQALVHGVTKLDTTEHAHTPQWTEGKSNPLEVRLILVISTSGHLEMNTEKKHQEPCATEMRLVKTDVTKGITSRKILEVCASGSNLTCGTLNSKYFSDTVPPFGPSSVVSGENGDHQRVGEWSCQTDGFFLIKQQVSSRNGHQILCGKI